MINPKFSIIIPTYNEENDIENTLKSLLEINYKNYNIFIIDDSNDNTTNIIKKYVDQNKNIKLIRPYAKRGRCEARNIGIKEADGEILIILNADVHLPKNFINQILIHYQNGADFVLVDSMVENMNNLYARYVECEHRYDKNNYNYVNSMKWSEGFSIKKEIALKTSLFPSNFCVPIEAGEDARFGEELEKNGAKKVIDLSIKVSHIAPGNFIEYWCIRKGRGRGTPQIRKFLDNWSYSKIILIECLKVVRFLLKFTTIIPMIYHNYKLAKYSHKSILIDTITFSYAWIIEQIAFSFGSFESLCEIIKKGFTNGR